MKGNDYFVYECRFEDSIWSSIRNRSHMLKGKAQHFLLKNKFTSRYFDKFEAAFISRTHWINKFRLSVASGKSRDEYIYKDISLNKLNYFEAIEIDDFDKYRRRIYSRFSKHQWFSSTRDKEKLKQTLSEVKEKFDYISWGGLFAINYSKKQTKLNDLISFVDVSYIKTSESYFIFKIEITPSKQFNDLFAKIVQQKDVGLSIPQYNTLWEILKTRKFGSSESIISSLKCQNLENLLFDMNYQVKQNLTKYFKGYFHSSKINTLLPCLEYYEVGNMSDFHRDPNLKYNFKVGFNGYYALADNELEVYINAFSRNEQRFIQIVKQKGHGNKSNQRENDLTNYAWVESHYLLRSLAFPCVFNSILIEQFAKLNKLKRKIYDFVNYTNRMNILKSIVFFLFHNKKYIKLKQTLTQILLTNKRFESEFTKQNIYTYTNEFELQTLEPRNNRIDKENKNLLVWIMENFGYRIKNLDKKTKDTNEIFKTIEELNSYRTNLFLQRISLFVAFLAVIFAFDKAKHVVGSLVRLFSHWANH